MAMGTRRQRQRQQELWYRRDLAEAPGHPFYRRLNQVLEEAGFDEFCEARYRKFYHEKLGRPSLAPGMYFRVMLIGFFEGIESERGILEAKHRAVVVLGLSSPFPSEREMIYVSLHWVRNFSCVSFGKGRTQCCLRKY